MTDIIQPRDVSTLDAARWAAEILRGEELFRAAIAGEDILKFARRIKRQAVEDGRWELIQMEHAYKRGRRRRWHEDEGDDAEGRGSVITGPGE